MYIKKTDDLGGRFSEATLKYEPASGTPIEVKNNVDTVRWTFTAGTAESIDKGRTITYDGQRTLSIDVTQTSKRFSATYYTESTRPNAFFDDKSKYKIGGNKVSSYETIFKSKVSETNPAVYEYDYTFKKDGYLVVQNNNTVNVENVSDLDIGLGDARISSAAVPILSLPFVRTAQSREVFFVKKGMRLRGTIGSDNADHTWYIRFEVYYID